MIEVTKKQYLILLDILSLNLNKQYYNSKLARELSVSDKSRDFRAVISLMDQYDVLEYGETIGSVITYSIKKKQLAELIANTDVGTPTLIIFAKGYCNKDIWEFTNEI